MRGHGRWFGAIENDGRVRGKRYGRTTHKTAEWWHRVRNTRDTTHIIRDPEQ